MSFHIGPGRHGDTQAEFKDFYERKVISRFKFIWAGHDHHLSYEKTVKGTNIIISEEGDASLSIKSKEERPLFRKIWLFFLILITFSITMKKISLLNLLFKIFLAQLSWKEWACFLFLRIKQVLFLLRNKNKSIQKN